ncbi:MAG: HK97 family phage prohead protease [Rikenellaceae bacterium]
MPYLSNGTWVKTDGVDISQYERNPVLLWMHWRGCLIGSIKDIRKEGDKITGEPFFDEAREESKLAKKQWEAGTLRMCSAGLDVLEVSEAVEKTKEGQYRATVTKSKLVEVSMVDIGGNDNALPVKLSYQGTELTLAAGENNSTLPLLKNNQKPEKTMNPIYTAAVALKLGLLQTASESEVLARVELLLGFESANKTLREEKEQMALSSITSVVQTAISEKRITADKKEHFINLGKTVGVESLKVTIEAINPTLKPMSLINNGGGDNGYTEYKKLSDVPGDKLLELRDNDKQTYMKLYKAEYGVDCKLD